MGIRVPEKSGIHMVNMYLVMVMVWMSNDDQNLGFLFILIYSKGHQKCPKTGHKSWFHVFGYFRSDIEAIIWVPAVTKLSNPPPVLSPKVGSSTSFFFLFYFFNVSGSKWPFFFQYTLLSLFIDTTSCTFYTHFYYISFLGFFLILYLYTSPVSAY